MPLSIILPAKNEAPALPELLAKLREHQPEAELIVVDYGSADDTATIAEQAGARVVRHPYSHHHGLLPLRLPGRPPADPGRPAPS